MKQYNLLISILFVSILSISAFAVDCFCDGCSTCTGQLNNVSCSRVLVSQNMTINSGYCLDNPENFSNKIFDCQGYTLSGSGVSGINLRNKSNILINNCKLNLTGFSGSALYVQEYSGDSTSNVTVNNSVLVSNSFAVNLQYAGEVAIQNSYLWSNNGFDFNINPSSSSCTHSLNNVSRLGGSQIIYSNSSLNLSNAVISELVLCGASNSVIENVTISNDRQVNGVLIGLVSNILFDNLTINSADSGLKFAGGINDNITIRNSALQNLKSAGVNADTFPSVRNSKIFNTRIHSQYSSGIRFRDVGATGIEIENVTIQSQSEGVYFRNFGTANNANITNVSIIRSPSWASSKGVSVEGGTFKISDSLLNQSNSNGIFAERAVLFVYNTKVFNNPGTDINLSNSVLTADNVMLDYNNNVSLEAKNVGFSSAQYSEISTPNLSYNDLGRALKVENNSAVSWISLNMSYGESELSGSEFDLKILKFNDSGWHTIPGSGVNTVLDYVFTGNQSSFSYFVPLEDLLYQHAVNQTTYVNVGVNQVIFDSASGSVERIIIPSSISETTGILLNMSALLNGTNVTVPNNITLVREGASFNYTVVIPAGTVISGPSGWDGTIVLPTVATGSFSVSSGTVNVVIDLGLSVELNFSGPVQILIGGMAGKQAAWSSTSSTLTKIQTICDNVSSAPANINFASPRECYGDANADLAIWTYHFTNFGAFTPGSGVVLQGGSGGGSRSYYASQGTLSADSSLKLELFRMRKYYFRFRDELHSILMRSLLDTEAEFTLESTPVDFSLNVSESEVFDLTGDNVPDVKVTLLSLGSFSAEVLIEEVVSNPAPAVAPDMGSVKVEEEPEAVVAEREYMESREYIPEPIPRQMPRRKVKTHFVEWLVLVLLVAVTVYLLYPKREKNRRK